MSRRSLPLAVILCAALAATVVLLAVPRPRPGGKGLMIACGEDLAGQIMAHAARTGTGEIGILGTGRVSFLQLSDCCGT